VKKLKHEGNWVRGVDIKYPPYSETLADDFVIADLRDFSNCRYVIDQRFDEVYQLAADMGGAGFVFVGTHDYDIMHNSAQINLNVIEACLRRNIKRVFYSSSACMYPEYNQMDPDNPKCSEDSAYPAAPDSEYGWEKLFSERLFLTAARNKGLEARVGRYHNIFGSEGSWNNGREKAPAALCRKVASAQDGGAVEIWGDGKQTRSFLHVDECIEATLRLTRSDWMGPVNIGSEEMITINELAKLVAKIGRKEIKIKNIPGPTGVRGRNSDNQLFYDKLQWRVSKSLQDGLEKTYPWVNAQVLSGLSDLDT
jgi:GDP-D-mannose 3', 5'-epimerase